MWDIGLTVMQFGIYQSKEAKTFKGKTPSLKEMKDTPTIMFYDEIWAKKKCKDLQLDRLTILVKTWKVNLITLLNLTMCMGLHNKSIL